MEKKEEHSRDSGVEPQVSEDRAGPILLPPYRSFQDSPSLLLPFDVFPFRFRVALE